MATPYQPRKITAPDLNEGDAPWFEGAAAGKLMVKYCSDCKQYHHYPRALCPFCYSNKTEWKQARGTGTIYTFSISRASGPIPYAIAYVTLDEGPSMMTNIVETDLDTIKVGQKVQVVFQPTDDPKYAVPMFKPA
jgi:uncharacterized OB-fold protein